MTRKTDRELAEQAKEKIVDEGTVGEYSVTLCPACNRPQFAEDHDPNEFVDADRTAWQISPARILDIDPNNPWDHICVTAKKVELPEEGEMLRVEPHKHDYSSEVYRAWKNAVNDIEKLERRQSENRGLGDFE